MQAVHLLRVYTAQTLGQIVSLLLVVTLQVDLISGAEYRLQ